MYQNLSLNIDTLSTIEIDEGRQIELSKLIDYIQSKVDSSDIINLNFICTHNSRRSHLAQIWASVAAAYYGIENVFCFSGGTEATAMFPMIRKTLLNQGFKIIPLSEEPNPVYAVSFSPSASPLITFSKKYDHPYNPSANFAAIMTCAHAEKNCPIIYGCDSRIPIMYEDPKISDGTDKQALIYLQRSEQIGREMLYVFEKVRRER